MAENQIKNEVSHNSADTSEMQRYRYYIARLEEAKKQVEYWVRLLDKQVQIVTKANVE